MRGRWMGSLLAVGLVATCATPTPRPAAPASRSALTGVPTTDPVPHVIGIENGLLPAVRVKGETVHWSLDERMRHHRVPGFSMAVISDYRVVWKKSYGVADADTGAPVTETTMFSAGSISKSVNAMLALMAVERGEIALD